MQIEPFGPSIGSAFGLKETLKYGTISPANVGPNFLVPLICTVMITIFVTERYHTGIATFYADYSKMKDLNDTAINFMTSRSVAFMKYYNLQWCEDFYGYIQCSCLRGTKLLNLACQNQHSNLVLIVLLCPQIWGIYLGSVQLFR